MAENWIHEEKFDFDLNLSGSSVDEGVLNTTPDDEVFIGPLTHKEKCMAFIVQEREAMKSVERLNPDQQAMLLRESALINLRIKSRGTPGHRNTSPVAVVRPMMAADIPTSSGIPSVVPEENKENDINLASMLSMRREVRASELRTPLITEESKKNIPAEEVNHAAVVSGSPLSMKKGLSQPLSRKTTSRLSAPVKPMNQNPVQFAQPLPLGTPSKSGSEGTVESTKGEQQQRLRRYSTIPKPGIPKSKSDASMPSGSISQGTKAGLIKPRTKSKQGTKALSQSSISKVPSRPPTATAKPELQLPSRKGILTSNDTPASKKKPQMRLSQKRTSLGVDRHQSSIGTPVGKNTSQKLSDKPRLKPGDQVTPVIKSRRSINIRKLNPDIVKPVEGTSSVNKVEPIITSENPKDIDVLPPPMTSSQSTMSTEVSSLKSEGIADQTCPPETASSPSIISTKVSSLRNEEVTVETCLPEIASSPSTISTEVKCLKSEGFTHEENKICAESKCEVAQQNTDNIQILDEAPLLIDISDHADLHTKESPPKMNKTDPFETGNTPPPLIDLGEILQPVREEDVNLIEF